MKPVGSAIVGLVLAGVAVAVAIVLWRNSAPSDATVAADGARSARDDRDVPDSLRAPGQDRDIEPTTIAPAPAASAAITGHVLDAAGRPIANALIALRKDDALEEDPDLVTATSDANGAFAIATPLVDEFGSLVVHHATHLPFERGRVAAGADVVVVLQDGIAVHGRVVDGDSDEPIAGASVSLGGFCDFGTKSDADGRFTSVADPSGAFATAHKDGWFDWTGVPLHAAAETEVVVRMRRREAHGIAFFIVTDADTGRAVEGLTARPGPVLARGGGLFSVGTSQFERKRTVHLAAPGFIGVTVPLGDHEAATPREAREVKLEHGTAVAGSVVDDHRRPVAGVRVTVEIDESVKLRADFEWASRTASATTDQDGKFRAEGLPGAAHCSVRARDAEPIDAVTVARGTLELAPIVVTPPPPIRGVVRAAANQEPIAGALVTVAWRDERRCGRTAPDGTFTLQGPREPTNVTAGARGFVRTTIRDVLPSVAGATAAAEPLVIALERGLVLDGIVVDAAHHPVPGAVVRVDNYEPPDDRPELARSSVHGREIEFVFSGEGGAFRLEGLAPGRYWLVAGLGGVVNADPDQGQPTVALEADAHGVEVLLSQRTLLVGRVIDATTGKGLTGFTYSIETEDSSSRSNQFDSDGRFVEFVEPNVSYSIVAMADGYAPQRIDAVEVHAGEIREVQLALTLESAIDGLVVDASGRPFAGAQVRLMKDPAAKLGVEPAVTDADGHFRVSQLPPGVVELAIDGSFDLGNGARLLRPLEIVPNSVDLAVGQVLTQKFVAGPTGPGRIDLDVTFADEMKDEVTLELDGPGANGGRVRVTLRQAGPVSVPGLEPGEYHVGGQFTTRRPESTSIRNFAATPDKITVAAGGAATVTVRLAVPGR